MIGALFGDLAGSIYEMHNAEGRDFPLLTPFSKLTDDSYMTIAVAKTLLETTGGRDQEICSHLVKNMQEIGRQHPDAGYGSLFVQWLYASDPKPYYSYGNGSAMRVSPVGWAFGTLEETLSMAELTASVTHNHPEGIKGAKAIAGCIYLARTGQTKKEIKKWSADHFGYDLNRTLAEIKPSYCFDATCQGSVPEAILAFLEGKDYEDVIRKAIELGGDSDTIACMAGGIAEAYGGMPSAYKQAVKDHLDEQTYPIVKAFERKYGTADDWDS